MNAGELFQRAYAATHEAADQLSALAAKPEITTEQLRPILDNLRRANCAAQELHLRLRDNAVKK